MSHDNHVFVREFLSEFYEHRFTSGLITESEYFLNQSVLVSDEFEWFSHELFARAPAPVEMRGCGTIRLIHLREMDGTEFPFLLALPSTRGAKQALTCFVGHRFLKSIQGPLRFNLAHVFNPYGIELRWSAQDLSATETFRDIISGIRNSKMCFFDTFATTNKPNVYIEVGIACAFRVPMILAEYEGGTSLEGQSEIPSDLQGLFRIRYTSYRELFRKLYFGLPNFIVKNRIRTTRRRR